MADPVSMILIMCSLFLVMGYLVIPFKTSSFVRPPIVLFGIYNILKNATRMRKWMKLSSLLTCLALRMKRKTELRGQ